MGDLNSYLREDPIRILEKELVNLVSKYDKNPYSYNFFASFAFPWVGCGLMDHAVATDAMADQVTRTKVWYVCQRRRAPPSRLGCMEGQRQSRDPVRS